MGCDGSHFADPEHRWHAEESYGRATCSISGRRPIPSLTPVSKESTAQIPDQHLPHFPGEHSEFGLLSVRQIVMLFTWRHRITRAWSGVTEKASLTPTAPSHAAKILEPSQSAKNWEEFIRWPSGVLNRDGTPENVIDPR